jgi:hypothetical protein
MLQKRPIVKMQGDSMQAILLDNMSNAKAIIIFSPRNERAVVLARAVDAQGSSGPAFYNIFTLDATSEPMGTTGLRAGKQNLEIGLLAMSDKPMA